MNVQPAQAVPPDDRLPRPSEVSVLRAGSPGGRGFTVFFTGLSGAGKSTLAQTLSDRLGKIGGRPVTLLDGDIVRKTFSPGLGFSREHRELNVRRVGSMAEEITKAGGIAICALIAPYDRVRREVRDVISKQGGFLLVHVATPLDVCEQRDCKGLYAKARAGLLKEFTGISDPYEVPADAEVVLDASVMSVGESCNAVLDRLRSDGFLSGEAAQ